MHSCALKNDFELFHLYALNIQVEWLCIRICYIIFDIPAPFQIVRTLAIDANLIIYMMLVAGNMVLHCLTCIDQIKK